MQSKKLKRAIEKNGVLLQRVEPPIIKNEER